MSHIHFTLIGSVTVMFPFCLHGQNNVPSPTQTLWEWDAEFLSDPTNLIDPEQEGSAYAQHLKFMDIWAPRLYPSGQASLLHTAVQEQKVYMQAHPKSGSPYTSNWENIGPNDSPDANNAGSGTGQIHAIAFDQDYDGITHRTLYCASNYGGLFKSTDAGDHWISLTDQALLFTSVSDIAVAGDAQHTVFISTGHTDTWNYSTGVFRSSNGGADWTDISTGIEYMGTGHFNIYCIEVSPGDPSLLYIASTNGIYKCDNALDAVPTWTLVFEPPLYQPWRGLAFSPADDATIYASGVRVYRSVDDGNNWEDPTNAWSNGLDLTDPMWTSDPTLSVSRINLAISPAAPDLVRIVIDVGKNGHGRNYAYTFNATTTTWTGTGIAYVTDNGDNTSSPIAGLISSPGWIPIAVSPAAAHASVIYYGYLGLRRSNDGGTTSAGAGTGLHDDKHSLAFTPTGTELWLGGDGGLYRSTNPYDTTPIWERRNNGLAVGFQYSISADPTDGREVIVAEQDDGINRLDPTDTPVEPWDHLYTGDGAKVLYSPTGREAWGYDYQHHFKQYKWTNGNFSTHTTYNPSAADPVGCGAWIAYEHPAMKIHEKSDRMYFGWSDIWEENDIHGHPTTGADMTGRTHMQSEFGDLPCNGQALRDAEISPSDRTNLYQLSQAKGSSADCPGGTHSRLFRSIMPVSDPDAWLPLEEVDLPSTDAFVVAVRCAPDNPNEVWVAYSGYVWDLKVYRSLDRGSHWDNMDPTGSLPNLPINDLVLLPGMPDDATHAPAAYIATDAGVYYSHDPLNEPWEHFNTGLPNVVVSDIDINYCAGKIYASTIGRAAWASDLAELPTLEKTISSSEDWTFQRNLAQDLHVTNHAILNIHAVVNFAPGKRLMIDPGSEVIIHNGGMLTNLCGEQWDGVEVRGNSGVSQMPRSNQGYLELRAGAIIENADIAIRLYQSDEHDVPDLSTTGGILKGYGLTANQVYIRNCTKGLHMLPYENRPNGGNEINNRTSLAWTVFETDVSDAEYCARLEDVSGVSFSHCTFRDNASSTLWYGEQRPNGIESLSSKFTVRSSTFWRLRSSIEASNDGLLNPAFIRSNTFDLCRWGILLDGVHAAEVTSNTFIVPRGNVNGNQDPLEQVDPPLGLYLHTCEGYEVEENHFSSDQAHAVGLVVTDNSSGANQFYKNTFNGLLVGSLLQGDNRDVDNQGLQCLCNDYGLGTANVYKIALTWGGEIAQFQGSPSVFPNPAIPAGNRFYPECLASTDESDIYVQDDGQLGFTYLRNSDAICDPACRTIGFVDVINTNVNYQDETQGDLSCPSRLSHGHLINDHLLKYALHKQEYSQLKSYLDGQLDGGDTPDLLAMINDGSISSFNLRLQLLAASPRLTDRVMIAAIQRSPAIDAWHLAQVLLANSPLTPDVLLTLNRSDVLPTYRDMVAAAQTGGLSLKSMLEAELAGYRLGMEGPRFDAVRFYLERDTVGDPLDSVLTVLGDPIVPSAAYNVACLHIARHDWSAAESILSNAANNGLDAGSIQVLELLLAIQQDPMQASALVVAATPDLSVLATGTTVSGAAARSLLAEYTSATFEHPVVLPGNRRARSFHAPTASGQEELSLVVMPNPARTTIRIAVKQPLSASAGVLRLYDAQGRSLRQWRIGSGIQLLEEDVNAYPTGQYRLTLITGDGGQRTAPFQVAR